MSKSQTLDPLPDAAAESAASAVAPAAARAPAAAETFVTATHEILFTRAEPTRCDACGGALGASSDADDEDGYGVPGRGVYLWARGDEVRFEHAPLCTSCASAIGMTALARWEIEEEEG